MTKYETVVIIRPDMTLEEAEKVTADVEKLINKEGKVLYKKGPELKPVAAAIQDFTNAYYVVMVFESEPDFVNEIIRNYNINEKILRHSLIRFIYDLDEIIKYEKSKEEKMKKENESVKEEKQEEVKEDKKEESKEEKQSEEE